ncbi:MAG: sigma-E factor regulatory protein RseB domain-containing protein [Planctomycetota bacterium]
MGRKLQLVLLALVVGTPAVGAALRQVRQHKAEALLLEAATAHRHTSYSGEILWNGPWKGKTFGVRHDHASGRTAYRMGPASLGSGKSGTGWFGKPEPRRTDKGGSKPKKFGKWDPKKRGFGKGGFGRSWRAEYVKSKPSSRLPDPAAWCVDSEHVVKNYRAEETGSDTYLGRSVRVVRVRPRHPNRPSLDLWLDAETSLPLKVTTYRPDGSLFRVAKFHSIKFGPQVVEERRLHKAHRFFGTPVPLDDPQASAGFRPLIPDYLPPGFALVEARVKQRATPHLSLLFSDGATAFEIGQWPVPTPAVQERYEARIWGERHAKRMANWHLRGAVRRLTRANGGEASGDAIVCRQRRIGNHTSLELRVESTDLRLTSRSDIDREEMLRVLRSLRRH